MNKILFFSRRQSNLLSQVEGVSNPRKFALTPYFLKSESDVETLENQRDFFSESSFDEKPDGQVLQNRTQVRNLFASFLRKVGFFLLFVTILNFFSAPCFAQAQAQGPKAEEALKALNKTESQELTPPEDEREGSYPDLTSQAAILIFLALLPFFVMLLTSFIKMVITLALLRSALGVQQTPPNQVINGIALLLTMYVMYPTGLQMYQNAKHLLDQELPKQIFSASTAVVALDVIDVAKEPLREFLIRNTRKQHLQGFEKIAQKSFPKEALPTLKETDFIIVVPAFITTQIRAAFEIGVLIYLPFFVIDLVTSNILLAMQMMMLSPLSISLPLKLLLVVMIDGWTILVQGLVLSFN